MDLSEIKGSVEHLMAILGMEGQRPKRSMKCPFHQDSSPSFSIWREQSKWFWKCHKGCGSGTVIDAVMVRDGLNTPAEAVRAIERELGMNVYRDEDYVEPVLDQAKCEHLITAAHTTLMDDFDLQETYMLGKRGIEDLEVMRKYRIGFREKLRFKKWRTWCFDAWVIPITRADGTLFGIKLHIEKRHSGRHNTKIPKNLWAPYGTYPKDGPKNGGLTLWPPPESFRHAADLYLCPGELKALAMIGAGCKATSITAGEGGKFPARLARRLAAVNPGRIIVPLDNDETGHRFFNAVKDALQKFHMQVLSIDFSEVEAEPDIADELAEVKDERGALITWYNEHMGQCPSTLSTDFYTTLHSRIAAYRHDGEEPDGPWVDDIRYLKRGVETGEWRR
jgi:hypothetical protein